MIKRNLGMILTILAFILALAGLVSVISGKSCAEVPLYDGGASEWDRDNNFASEPVMGIRPGISWYMLHSDIPMEFINVGFYGASNTQAIDIEAVALNILVDESVTWETDLNDPHIVLDSVRVDDPTARYTLDVGCCTNVMLRGIGSPGVSWYLWTLDSGKLGLEFCEMPPVTPTMEPTGIPTDTPMPTLTPTATPTLTPTEMPVYRFAFNCMLLVYYEQNGVVRLEVRCD